MSLHVLSEAVAPETKRSASVCVVGAGIAGLVLAKRLARKHRDQRVIVVESGGMSFDPETHALNQIDDIFGNYRGGMDGRFRGLGGSSVRWGGRLLPLGSQDGADRPHVGTSAWPIDSKELDRYRPDIEQLFKIDRNSYEENFLDTFSHKCAIPRDDHGFILRFPKIPRFKDCNLVHLMKDELRASKNLEIWLGATVVGFGVDAESGRLRTITARSLNQRIISVQAAEFVFAAGAIESTRLMLLLGLEKEGRIFEKCCALGRYFHDHIGAGVAELRPHNRTKINQIFGYRFVGATRRAMHMEITARAQAEQEIGNGYAHVIMGTDPGSALGIVKRLMSGVQRGKIDARWTDLHKLAMESATVMHATYWRLVKKQMFWPVKAQIGMYIWFEQMPAVQNRITLSSKRDRFGLPVPRLEWKLTETDERTFRVLVSRLKDYWNRSNLALDCDLEWRPELQGEVAALGKIATDRFHPAGSTRMGINPVESVVDTELRSHHVKNLTIASASVFPSSGAANPTYTILQLAMRAADSIGERLKHRPTLSGG